MKPTDMRALAMGFEQAGFAHYARAFNLTGDAERPYTTTPAVQQRAMELLRELHELVCEAELLPNPQHAPFKAARKDRALQKMLDGIERT